jgi:hypothetical protein
MRLQLAEPMKSGIADFLVTMVAAVVYVLLLGWISSVEWAIHGGGSVSGNLRIWVVPILIECLAAALIGVGLGALLQTDRPALYGILLGSALLLFRAAATTVHFGSARWQDLAWIGLDLLLPACVAAAATLWGHRRRRAAALKVGHPVTR